MMATTTETPAPTKTRRDQFDNAVAGYRMALAAWETACEHYPDRATSGFAFRVMEERRAWMLYHAAMLPAPDPQNHYDYRPGDAVRVRVGGVKSDGYLVGHTMRTGTVVGRNERWSKGSPVGPFYDVAIDADGDAPAFTADFAGSRLYRPDGFDPDDYLRREGYPVPERVA